MPVLPATEGHSIRVELGSFVSKTGRSLISANEAAAAQSRGCARAHRTSSCSTSQSDKKAWNSSWYSPLAQIMLIVFYNSVQSIAQLDSLRAQCFLVDYAVHPSASPLLSFTLVHTVDAIPLCLPVMAEAPSVVTERACPI